MMRSLSTLCRLVIGGAFIWAAATKVTELQRFGTEIANYQLLPPVFVPWFAVALPGIELVAGVACLAGVRTRAAVIVLTALTLVFIVALTQALVRGINLECGCFGGAEQATWGTVWRDVALLAAAGHILWHGPGPLALERERA